MFEEKLAKIGFKIHEARIYLELLKTNAAQAARTLAKNLDINRSSIYSFLETLEERGVIKSFTNHNVRYFTAEDPNALIGYLDRKSKIIEYNRREILINIPKFRSLKGNYDQKKLKNR